jgi:hypothetical protein
MTQSQRRAHLRAWVILAPLILGLLFAALVARPEVIP